MRVPDTGGALVWVQRGSVGPPVYFFHPLGGSAAVYGQLALHIGRDRPARGLQAVGLLPGREPDRTIDDMAHRYAAAIAADRPPGPPVLIGYSMGGVLAVEAARLLAATLPAPPVIVAIDCDPLYTPSDDAGAWRILVRQVLHLDLAVEPLGGLLVDEALEMVRAAGAAQGRIPLRFGLDRLHAMLKVCAANEHAIAAHTPRPYPATIHLVRSAGAGTVAGADAWHGFADRVELSVVPADHRTIMGSVGCPAVAARIRRLLVR
jgi:thioesterase domain-containing protein